MHSIRETNPDIIQAEEEVALWARHCLRDMKLYGGLRDAIEDLNKIVLKTILEVRYGT